MISPFCTCLNSHGFSFTTATTIGSIPFLSHWTTSFLLGCTLSSVDLPVVSGVSVTTSAVGFFLNTSFAFCTTSCALAL